MLWPDGAHSAACLTFDLDGEEVWLAEVPDSAGRPGVRSLGAYGVGWGLRLVLERLRERGLRATFFVPGRLVENFPHKVAQILEDGHEVAHHGYTHRNPAKLDPEEEREELERGLEALRAVGVEAVGYRAPAWDVSARTYPLLAELGFTYASNLMSSVTPFREPSSGVIELPVHWVLDDAAHLWFSHVSFSRPMPTAAQVLEVWLAEAEGIHSLGGLAVHTCHPQVIGRPGRLAILDGLLDSVQRDGTWVATAAEVAEWVAAHDDALPDLVDP